MHSIYHGLNHSDFQANKQRAKWNAEKCIILYYTERLSWARNDGKFACAPFSQLQARILSQIVSSTYTHMRRAEMFMVMKCFAFVYPAKFMWTNKGRRRNHVRWCARALIKTICLKSVICAGKNGIIATNWAGCMGFVADEPVNGEWWTV